MHFSYLNRWLSPDAIVPDPTNPQSLNRYSYVNNNPLRYSDPTGHEGNDVVDQLQKSNRFSDSIMDLIRKLGESDTGSKLLTFLLQNTDITIHLPFGHFATEFANYQGSRYPVRHLN